MHEAMTSTTTVDHQRTDGSTLRLTFAEPDRALRGGLVVLHEGHGVTDGVLLLVKSLAGEGWLTVTPHIESGEQLTQRDLLEATDRTLEWLTDRGVEADLRGVVGFDLGGTAALVVASHRKFGAAVSVGGQAVAELPKLLEIAGRVTSPWLGMYGDAGDEVGEAEVEQLREAAASAKVATNVVRYPGANHRFDADPNAAAEAWQRTLDWFDAHLR
ncbi:dienelactone hydrolase family protein [Amycolatopsis echigonensis]